MGITLVRNLNSKRDKEQEDSFENTANIPLYFDINKTISKIDAWNIINIKKLINNVDLDSDIKLEFTKWNNKIELLYKSLNPKLSSSYELEDSEKQYFINKDIKSIHELILNSEDENKKLAILFYIGSLIRNQSNVIQTINTLFNDGIVKLNLAIDIILPMYLMEIINE